MSNIKVRRSAYSNLEKYDLNSILYVSPTQQPGCAPAVSKESKERYREDLGSFSIYAAVRPPYNCCSGCGECGYGKLTGVT